MQAGGALSDRLSVEWQYPIYVNQARAVLRLARPVPGGGPTRLTITFRRVGDQRVPASPVPVSFPADRQRRDVPLSITHWPDGEYLTTIRDLGPDGGSLVRVLRKQTTVLRRPPSEPMDVSGLTVLFVDDWRIARVTGLERRVHPAEAFAVTDGMVGEDHPHQNVKEFCLEGDGSVAVRFYTMDRRRRDHRHYVGRSRDLLHWEIEPVPAGAGAESGGLRSRVEVPRRWLDPGGTKHRYRLYDPVSDGPVDIRRTHVQYSGWGRESGRWGPVPVAARSTYPIWRLSEREFLVLRRTALTTDRHEFTDEEAGGWGDSNDNWGGQWLSTDGRRLHFCQARVIPRHDPFLVRYDNIAGSRVLVLWTTTDGITWSPSCMAAPGDGDAGTLQFYGATSFRAEGGELRLAYLWVYDVEAQQIGLELACSRDDLLWHRFPGHPKVVANGPIGSWNFGLVAPLAAAPLSRDGHV